MHVNTRNLVLINELPVNHALLTKVEEGNLYWQMILNKYIISLVA